MRYIVQPGDTLWSTAATQLGDGSKWLRIASLDSLTNPYRILVDRQLTIGESAPVGRLIRADRSPLQGGMCYADKQAAPYSVLKRARGPC